MFFLFSVYDRVAQSYGPIVQQRNEAVAARAFQAAVCGPGDGERNLLSDHPDDFELRVLASFDETTGEVVAIGPNLVLSARVALRLSETVDPEQIPMKGLA